MKKLIEMALEASDYEAMKMLPAYCGKNYNVTSGRGWTVATHPSGDVLPLICAHVDTVKRNDKFKLIFKKGVYTNKYGILGGDDRAGVAIILGLVMNKTKAHFAFFDGEESGCTGSRQFANSFEGALILTTKVSCYIGLDRRGNNDAAVYDYSSDSLMAIIAKYGYKKAWGSVTDVSAISDIFPKPTVNLSVGFNQEHTANETLKLSSCRNTYNNIQKILTDLEELSFNDLRRENKWGSSYESYGRGGGRSTYGGSSYIDDTWEDDDYYDHPNIKPPFYRLDGTRITDKDVISEIYQGCGKCMSYDEKSHCCIDDWSCVLEYRKALDYKPIIPWDAEDEDDLGDTDWNRTTACKGCSYFCPLSIDCSYCGECINKYLYKEDYETQTY